MAETITEMIERESVLEEYRKTIAKLDVKGLVGEYKTLVGNLKEAEAVTQEKYNEYQTAKTQQRELELKLSALKDEWARRLELTE